MYAPYKWQYKHHAKAKLKVHGLSMKNPSEHPLYTSCVHTFSYRLSLPISMKNPREHPLYVHGHLVKGWTFHGSSVKNPRGHPHHFIQMHRHSVKGWTFQKPPKRTFWVHFMWAYKNHAKVETSSSEWTFSEEPKRTSFSAHFTGVQNCLPKAEIH